MRRANGRETGHFICHARYVYDHAARVDTAHTVPDDVYLGTSFALQDLIDLRAQLLCTLVNAVGKPDACMINSKAVPAEPRLDAPKIIPVILDTIFGNMKFFNDDIAQNIEQDDAASKNERIMCLFNQKNPRLEL